MSSNNTYDDDVVNTSFNFPYNLGDEQKAIIDTEKELRLLINTIMTDKVGASWLSDSGVLGADVHNRLVKVQQDEANTLRNNPVGTASLLEYCYIRDLKEIIDKHWDKGFSDIFHTQKRTSTMLQILSEFRNPHMHGREKILFLHQKHLCLGIAGEILLIVEKWRMGFKQKVKSYQCEFRFKPPNNSGGDSDSLLTKEQFMDKIKQQWIESLRAKVIKIEDKSGEKSFGYLLTFPEGEVTISFEGIHSDPQREHDWYARLIVTTDKLELIDWMVKEVERPYWVYRIILIDKLDVSYLESQIGEKSGHEITGSGEGFTKDTRTGQKISNGRSVEYPFGQLRNDAKIKAQLSRDENGDSVIKLWFISGTYHDGFYRAHTLLRADKILSSLLGYIAMSEIQQIIRESCVKPSK